MGANSIHLFLGARVLQVVHRAAVGDCAEQRRQFQRRHRNARAEAGHHADAAEFRSLERQDAGLLAGDIQAGLLAEAEHFGVMVDAVEAQPRAENIEVLIVGARQRLRQVKGDVAAGVDVGVLADHAFGQRGKRRHQLDGGTRNEAAS